MPTGEAPPEAPNPDDAQPLAENPDHAGVLDDELEAVAQTIFGSQDDAPAATDADVVEPEGDEPSGDDEAGDAGTGGDGAEGAPAPPAADDTPDLFQITDDLSLTRAEAQELAEFQQYLRSDPRAAQAVVEALQALNTPPAPPETPPAPTQREVPEELDLDDPAIAALWHQHQATLDHIARLEATVQTHDNFVTQSAQEQMQTLLNSARTTYQAEHNLSEPEMQQVYDVAGRLQVLPALLSPVDPVTGVPRQVDQISAMKEAFEMARWNIPALREREMQLKVTEQKADTKRKQKLSSLGGSSGSAPRSVPEPKNEQERRAAMIAAVAEFQNGEGA